MYHFCQFATYFCVPPVSAHYRAVRSYQRLRARERARARVLLLVQVRVRQAQRLLPLLCPLFFLRTLGSFRGLRRQVRIHVPVSCAYLWEMNGVAKTSGVRELLSEREKERVRSLAHDYHCLIMSRHVSFL